MYLNIHNFKISNHFDEKKKNRTSAPRFKIYYVYIMDSLNDGMNRVRHKIIQIETTSWILIYYYQWTVYNCLLTMIDRYHILSYYYVVYFIFLYFFTLCSQLYGTDHLILPLYRSYILYNIVFVVKGILVLLKLNNNKKKLSY